MYTTIPRALVSDFVPISLNSIFVDEHAVDRIPIRQLNFRDSVTRWSGIAPQDDRVPRAYSRRRYGLLD
jgi:hypothetical protein